MKVLLVGDSHMNTNFMHNAFVVAEANEADLIIQLGDFGFWDQIIVDNLTFPQIMDHYAQVYKIPLWVVEGNHDDPKVYERYRVADLNSPRLSWIPRGEVFTLDDVRVGFFGGAVSIDYHHRILGDDWFPEELATDKQCEYAASQGPIDVWLTHDAVDVPYNRRVLKFGEIVDMRISIQRHLLSLLRYDLKPSVHVHGHWHNDYHCGIPIGDNHVVETYGLRHESKKGLMLADISRQEDGSVFKVLLWNRK
jgi:predicted phosphodiesterase